MKKKELEEQIVELKVEVELLDIEVGKLKGVINNMQNTTKPCISFIEELTQLCNRNITDNTIAELKIERFDFAETDNNQYTHHLGVYEIHIKTCKQ